MYGTGTKKMLIILILEILKKYSDENHRLTQQDIVRLLDSEYGMKCDRRSVRNNILSLLELGYEINMDKGYYLVEREFDDTELRVLIDSVLFSKMLTGNQAKILINKLQAMGNKYFESSVSHNVAVTYIKRTENKQVMYSISAINNAIEMNRKISFKYNDYGLDYKLHPRDKDYIVNPYQLVFSNGIYYLLGNYDKYDNISYYRIDKISDVEICNEEAKPMKQVEGLEDGFNLSKHMKEHAYMFSGTTISVKVKCDTKSFDTLIDWFGKDIRIVEKHEDSEQLIVRVKSNENAMLYWALQYGANAEVIEPYNLRVRIKNSLNDMLSKYEAS